MKQNMTVVDKQAEKQRKIQLKQIKIFTRETNYIPVECGVPDAVTPEYHRIYLEHLGFTLHGIKLNMFECDFPDGWYLKRLPMSDVWTYLHDNKKRKRAAIFFKFVRPTLEGLEVVTHINYMVRYRGISGPDAKDPQIIYGRVLDSETTVIHQFPPIHIVNKKGTDGDTNEYAFEVKKAVDDLWRAVDNWLNKHYPLHKQINAYWEDE